MNEEMSNNMSQKSGNNGFAKFLVIILILFVCGISYYKFFMYDKDNSNKKDNNVVDNGNNNNENKTAISKEFEEKVKYQVLNIPFEELLDKKYNYKYLYESHVIYEVLEKITGEEDSNKPEVKYYKSADIISKVKEVFNYDLKFDRKEYGGCSAYNRNNHCFVMEYDNNTSKLVTYPGSAVAGESEAKIVDSSYENNIYKVKYLLVNYDMTELCYDKTKDITDCQVVDINKQKEEYYNSHKDELSQYEVSFKINSDNTYEFVNVKKVN